jgi:hypothetical protein
MPPQTNLFPVVLTEEAGQAGLHEMGAFNGKWGTSTVLDREGNAQPVNAVEPKGGRDREIAEAILERDPLPLLSQCGAGEGGNAIDSDAGIGQLSVTQEEIEYPCLLIDRDESAFPREMGELTALLVGSQ